MTRFLLCELFRRTYLTERPVWTSRRILSEGRLAQCKILRFQVTCWPEVFLADESVEARIERVDKIDVGSFRDFQASQVVRRVHNKSPGVVADQVNRRPHRCTEGVAFGTVRGSVLSKPGQCLYRVVFRSVNGF